MCFIKSFLLSSNVFRTPFSTIGPNLRVRFRSFNSLMISCENRALERVFLCISNIVLRFSSSAFSASTPFSCASSVAAFFTFDWKCVPTPGLKWRNLLTFETFAESSNVSENFLLNVNYKDKFSENSFCEKTIIFWKKLPSQENAFMRREKHRILFEDLAKRQTKWKEIPKLQCFPRRGVGHFWSNLLGRFFPFSKGWPPPQDPQFFF